MENRKVWSISGQQGLYTDVELRMMIKEGNISPLDEVSCREIKNPVKLKDTIYNELFKESKNDQTV